MAKIPEVKRMEKLAKIMVKSASFFGGLGAVLDTLEKSMQDCVPMDEAMGVSFIESGRELISLMSEERENVKKDESGN